MELTPLEQLRDWLYDGAAGIHFDMDHGLMTSEDCGTVCCIAGAAYILSHTAIPKEHLPWETVRDVAQHWLGLEDNDMFFGHDLFSHHLAPDHCTPEQAAQAVQNVIDGKEPWI